MGHIFFFHPVFERLHELLTGDPVASAQFVWLKFGTFEEELIRNLLPHDIALARVLFGRIAEGATVFERAGIRTATDYLSLRLDFGNGVEGCSIYVDRCAAQQRKTVRVKTVSGNVFVWDQDELYRLDQHAGFLPIFQGNAEPLQREAVAFIRSLDENTSDFLTGEIAVDVARMIESIAGDLCGMEA